MNNSVHVVYSLFSQKRVFFFPAESEMPSQSESLVKRRLRPAASAQDVKALFNSPHGYYSDSSQQPTSPMHTLDTDEQDVRRSPERPIRHMPSASLGSASLGGGSNSLYNGSTLYEPRSQGRSTGGLGHRHQLSDLWVSTQTVSLDG